MLYLVGATIILFLIILAMYLFAYKFSAKSRNHASKQLLYNFTPNDSNYRLNDLTTYFNTQEIIEYEI